MDLSVIVPCYNEAESLPSFVDAATSAFSPLGDSWELIFVNDGSSDGTEGFLRAFVGSGRAPHATLVNFSRNFGKEPALLAGLRQARGSAVAFIDADLQQPPATLVEMYRLLEGHDEYDVVAACQRERPDHSLRSRLSAGFYGLFNRVSDITLEPGASDFRVFRREVADALLSLPECHRFTKGLFAWVGFRTLPYPYAPDERVSGKSRWSMRGLTRYALEGMVSFTTVPLRISGYVGAVAAVVGFVYIIFVLVDALVLRNTPAGYPTLLSVMLLLGGLILLSLGIIGEYVARIYLEGKRRPAYIAASIVSSDATNEDGRPTASGMDARVPTPTR